MSIATHVRWMIRRDMDEVLSIENASFDTPWTEKDFLEQLRQKNVIGMVAERGEKVVGYMLYELHKPKLEVINFAVKPENRKTGVGMEMIKKLKSKLSSHRRTRLETHVRESNLPGQLFFKKMGFTGKIAKRFYEEEDAVKFAFCLAEDENEGEGEMGLELGEYYPANRLEQFGGV